MAKNRSSSVQVYERINITPDGHEEQWNAVVSPEGFLVFLINPVDWVKTHFHCTVPDNFRITIKLSPSPAYPPADKIYLSGGCNTNQMTVILPKAGIALFLNTLATYQNLLLQTEEARNFADIRSSTADLTDCISGPKTVHTTVVLNPDNSGAVTTHIYICDGFNSALEKAAHVALFCQHLVQNPSALYNYITESVATGNHTVYYKNPDNSDATPLPNPVQYAQFYCPGTFPCAMEGEATNMSEACEMLTGFYAVGATPTDPSVITMDDAVIKIYV